MNRSARLHGKGDFRVEDVPIPEIGPEDVLVQMAFVGMCRSDVHFFDEGHIDTFVVDKPMTLGHELSGVISKVGAKVKGLKPGENVAVDNIQPCFQCKNCLDRRFNICSKLKCAGLPHVDGGYARFMATPAYTCHKLPENVSLQAGALMEPLSVTLHGLHRGKITPGEVVVVIGAGPIGLLTLQSAKALGARKVLVVDINEKRLELAKSLGADVIFNSSGHTDPEKTAEAIKAALEEEADLGVECTGAPGTINTAIYACRVGGRVVVQGIGDNIMSIHIGAAALREIDLIGSICNTDFPEAVELVAAGKVNVLPLITHVLPLENVTDGINLVRDGRRSIKVLIDCQK
ncbi:hypothetical protein BsWGS_24800 [Bradybaena similaris]